MPTISGRNVKVEVALTFDTAIDLAANAVSKAYPPVVTKATHGLTDGEVGFFTVSDGMVELAEQAALVDNAATGTFEIPGLDSTDYSTFTTGTFTAAATWGTLAESTAYAIGGGAAQQLDDTRLIDAKNRSEAGNLASQDVTIDVKPQEVSGAAMAFIERQAQRGRRCLFKISKNGRVLRVFYGTPSMPGESVSTGQLATGQMSVTVPAWAVKPSV